MLLILLVGAIFYRLAKRRALSTWLWAFLGVATGYFGAILGGGLMVLAEGFVTDKLVLLAIAALTTIGSLVGLYLIMDHIAKGHKRVPLRDDVIDE